ncbi:MAG TPA: CoA-acylating methylmalonate-semialdehyde dehydrogenase [Ktedonobacterales bacterium]|jgi:malonate-semialdehyde dehydrogenase (acetylating)/methylmalonate-semialdehyde dehydrogenase|nr:CoA-acylating methylmalonate-semialdehyde dehydrogenase [Ktedonobacterales bacterium]
MTTASDVCAIQNLVGGDWIDSQSGQTLPIPNPATGETLAHVPLSTAAEVRDAVTQARAAWPAWRDTPVIDRARVLFRMRDLLEAHMDDLAASVTAENGKTLGEARGEVRRGLEVVEFACGMPSLMQGSSLSDVSRGIDTTMLRVPLGVVAGITPFNFPAMIPLWMAPIALAAGNCFVHKPSERTPLTSNLLAELWLEAGLPAGVLSVTHGAKAVVDALLSDPDISAVSFVGSQPVAAYVYATAAAHGKRVQALAGAKNFVIVTPDAQMEQAADIVLSSAFGNAGERCLASSVVVTVGDAAERLTPLLVERAQALRVGNGADSATEMGPVIRSEHLTRVRDAIARGLSEGARLALDGRNDSDEGEDAHADAADAGEGYYLRPSIFTDVTSEMSLAREEIFGPVLSVMSAPTLDEAITLANRSRFGNAAVICTTSGAAARTFQMRIEAGMVGVNIGVPGPVAWFPFAGWKQSFYGDLHATGMDAVNFYTERRVITSRW